MRLGTWNILHGDWFTPKEMSDSSSSLANSVQRIAVDILGLQEVDHFHPRSGAINQTAFIAESGRFTAWAFAPCFLVKNGEQIDVAETDAPLHTNQHSSEIPSYGIAMCAKTEPDEWLRIVLPKAKLGRFLPVKINNERKWIWATDHIRVAIAGRWGDLIVVNTHLSFVWPFQRVQLWMVKRWASQLESHYNTKKVFVMGDFNIRRLNPFSRFKSLHSGLTFPVWKLDRQIDYIVSRNFSGRDGRIDQFETSDHCSLSVDVPANP